MDETTLRFEVEGFDGGVESLRVGDRIEIAYSGMPVIAFDVKDSTARHWAIASLVEARLKGKTVARLCHASPAQVTYVKQRLRGGGYDALVALSPGRPKKLTGRRLARARELREQGHTTRVIGEAVGVSWSTVAKAVRDVQPCHEERQEDLPGAVLPMDDGPRGGECPNSTESVDGLGVHDEVGSDDAMDASAMEAACSSVEREKPEELQPGEPLPSCAAEHPCRYSGTLLICAAAQVLGLYLALAESGVRRPKKSVYKAFQAVMALLSAWAAGYRSLEAMHERDARALGVVLGLERSPSVRTLHRAIAQMAVAFDPIALGTWLLRGLMAAVGKVSRIFGVDGHFKAYYGKEPIDKGWDTKRRLAHRGLADVLVHDEHGRIWLGVEVGAGDGLHKHLVSQARQLRDELGDGEQVVLGFDRGGFDFEELNALDRDGIQYVAWVPSSVSLPDLSSIAPAEDGVGEQRWTHPKLSDGHKARLLVQRDGVALVPAATNVSEEVSATDALEMLRRVRGWQENDIKAARAFAHIDRLVDRGGAKRARDDRLVDNPTHRDLSTKRREAHARVEDLQRSEPISRRDHAVRNGGLLVAELEEALLAHQMSALHAKVPRCALDLDAQRAWLKTRNRALLQPLKYVLANSRRWLLGAMGSSLAPSDAEWDGSATSRTLEALIRAPGTVRFGRRQVVVTLELPLPPQPHERLAHALETLDDQGLRFSDGRRSVLFRLAPRPTRQALPSATAGAARREKNSD